MSVEQEEEFETNGAASIEERALAGEAEEPEDDGQFTIPGTRSNMTTAAGGRRPQFSEAKMDSLALRLTGEFKKEDRVRLVIDCVVRDVRFPDEYDKAGNVVRTRRVHVFKPIAVEPEEIPPGE